MNNSCGIFAASILALGLAAAPALAQEKSPASDEYEAAMKDMQSRMMEASDDQADVEFAKKMIEHHQGGVAMVDIVLKYTEDEKLREMAQKTKAMQEKETKELQAWIEENDK
ncbi:DUF305 domain-containing protein [Faunimonas sp. B44]|uniref:DUF305 domain-containing protein n=1 Tax=Faunimonas sp. B44 TaxID=3461493 RepID=UPI0040444743